MVLVDGLADSVEIGGERVPIETDFRAWLLLDALLFDREVRDEERQMLALELIFGEENVPLNRGEAFRAIINFYTGETGGKEREKLTKTSKAEKRGIAERAYDFSADWGYIYAAFLQAYGIDLTTARLHWWQFRALFAALPEDCMMCKIIGYRTMDLSKIKDKDQRAMYTRLKEAHRLGSGMTTEEKIASAGALFAPKL